MSEEDRLIILFILSVVFLVLALSTGTLVGVIGAIMSAAFWYHLRCLEKEKKKA